MLLVCAVELDTFTTPFLYGEIVAIQSFLFSAIDIIAPAFACASYISVPVEGPPRI